VSRSLTDELRALPPGLHGEGNEFWGLAWPALRWLEREVKPGMSTLETGAGSSTLAFAAGGADHIAVTPDAGEETRIRAQADRLGIDHSRVRFELGPSHEVLPRLDATPLDLVLIDGAHGFPYPVLDWWFTAGRLKVGGRMLIDDAYMPPVAMLVDALRAQAGWTIEESVGYRTVVARKAADAIPHWDWSGERIGGRMNFRYLPPRERAVAAVRHRAFSTRAGLALVGLARRRSALRWRRTG
jgi:Methyltransferase domain